MEPEEETGSSSQNQNLHDLQNYLVTFKNEIENSDDVVLTNIGVDSSDVNDLYSGSTNHDLQDPGDSEVVSNQFSSGFYSEQGMLGTTLSDEPTQQQIQNMVSSSKQDIESEMNSTKDDENVNSIDLDSMQAQMAAAVYTDTQLNQSLQGIQSASAQGIIMTSLEDSLDPTNGKMIQIVSLGGEDGQYLSLGDGQQMQILNSEDLGLTSESLVENIDTSVDLNTSSTATVMNSSNPPMALVSLSGNTLTAADMPSNNSSGGDSGINIVTPLIKTEIDGTSNQIATSMPGSSGTSVVVDGNGGANSVFNAVGGVPQLVALSGTGDGGQPQLFAVHRPGFAAEPLQMANLLGTTEGVNQDLSCHTITIMPSDLTQSGDMNYVLVLSQPDGVQGDKVASVAQLCDLKQEGSELGDAIVDENGITKNMLRLFPKKFVTDINQPLVCDYCNYTSPKRYLLTRHMKSHSEERPFKCESCHRGFKTPASLLNHVNTHTGTRPHKCKTCEAAFTTSGELVRHIRYRHTFEKPHRCPECDYASVELSKLKRHMRSHTGERPYKCPNCPYASPDTYKLKRHMRIHTGEKPYQCDICHARFTQSNSLKAHKLIHSGNKPVYQCSLCPTTCGRKTDLKIHFNKLHSVGSPLDCKKCGKAFSDRYSYKQHIRTHDMDKCFKCEQCDFIAATEKQLEVHTSAHGKKYQCDECHLTFILKHLLDKHKVMFHSNISKESSSTAEEKVKDDHDSRFSTLILNSKYDLADLPSESEEGSNLLNCAPSTSDTLHKNLMQDIKEGKLGDVPQVVIVHPDGSSEEISSKLTGDKWSIEELFCTATNNGQTVRPDDGEKEILGEEESVHLKEKQGSEMCSSSSSLSHDPSIGDSHASTLLLQTTIDQMNESAMMSQESHSGMSQLCEASTQAELESDTDSSGEIPDHNNILMNVVSTAQLTSVMDGNMMEAVSGKQRNAEHGTSSLSTTDSASDQELAATNISSSLSSEPIVTTSSSSSSSSSSSISNNASNSYLKSLMMQRPIVIKAPPKSSIISSTSSLLSSSSSSPHKKLTSLLQFPKKPKPSISTSPNHIIKPSISTNPNPIIKSSISTNPNHMIKPSISTNHMIKPSISTNPNHIIKHNSGGHQYSLLKNLNFNPSSSLPSSQSTHHSSQSNLDNRNNVKLFINPSTTLGSDNTSSSSSLDPSPSANVNISTTVSSLSSQSILNQLNNSSSLSLTLNTDSEKQPELTTAVTTSHITLNDNTTPFTSNSQNENTCQTLLNMERESALSQSEKHELSCVHSVNPSINSVCDNPPLITSRFTQSTITVRGGHGPIHNDTNTMGLLNQDGSISTLTTVSENAKNELAAFLQNKESDDLSKMSDTIDSNDNDRKNNVSKLESERLCVSDADGIIWNLVENVDNEGQILGMENSSVDTTCDSSHEDSSRSITCTNRSVVESASGEEEAMTSSSSKLEPVLLMDSLSEDKTPSASLPAATSRKGKSTKRHVDMDQSLVVPGKRVRKALVKVSL